jgi:adenylate cyclase, class 2
MSLETREIEVKYAIADLPALEARLNAIGAQIIQERIFENNLRFDTRDSGLNKTASVLRLRQDTAARMTFKGPSVMQTGVLDRLEIEFVVSDFNAARALLEALGFQISMVYEKYRAMYRVGNVIVTLDEMPYGSFAEIEGPDVASLQDVSRQLGLNWDAAVPQSYSDIFVKLKEVMGWNFRDLSFENFANREFNLQELDIFPADQPLSR